MSDSPTVRGYRLRSRLLLLVSLLVGLVLLSSLGTVLTALASSSAITTAHEMELASRKAALLSVIVREQYIHEAHTIILRDRSHVEHHDEWVVKLDAELKGLRPEVDSRGTEAIEAIREASEQLRDVFSHSILPAIDRQDWDEVRRAHDRANALVDDMTLRADSLANYFDVRAIEAEREAERLVRIALVIAIALGCAAAALALVAGRNLWRAFSTPLGSLELVARQVAKGDRSARVGPVAALELAVVGEAINRMLDALARAEGEVVSSERLAAIGRIAAGVAHEVNNPIAVIRGYVKTMQQDTENTTLREELAILDEEAAACQRIAEDLLVYARSPRMAPVPVQAEEILREAADRCEAPPSLRRESSSPPPVVVEADPALISVDPLRIRQVIVNLINNAREASSSSEAVIVRGSRQDSGYRIEILDRGVGMAEEDRERAFEPFFTMRRDGTGLGLAVCYGLVTAHGGTIRAEPRAGGGSRFVVELPSVIVEEEEPSPEP